MHWGRALYCQTKTAPAQRFMLVAGVVLALSGCVGSGPVAQFAGDQGGEVSADTSTLALNTNIGPLPSNRAPSTDGGSASGADENGLISSENANGEAVVEGDSQTLAVSNTPPQTNPAKRALEEAVDAGNPTAGAAVVEASNQPAQTDGLKIVRPGETVRQTASADVPENAAATATAGENGNVEGTADIAAVQTETDTAVQAADAPQPETAKKPRFSFFNNPGLSSTNRGERFQSRRDRGAASRSTRRTDEAGTTRIASAHTTASNRRLGNLRSKQKNNKTRVIFSKRGEDRSGSVLPGVKSRDELLGIKREEPTSRSGASSNRTVVASAGSLGRLSPNSLRLQHSKVDVHCLKSDILRIIKIVEKRYGSRPIITSAYRSPKYNRRIGGARNSTHIRCIAVDMQVEGVSKWDLAKFLRTVPGRGGVGTYCRTKSVHVDTSKKRDWHHPCRRSKVRKRKKA